MSVSRSGLLLVGIRGSELTGEETLRLRLNMWMISGMHSSLLHFSENLVPGIDERVR